MAIIDCFDELKFQRQSELMDIWKNVLPSPFHNEAIENSEIIFKETKQQHNFLKPRKEGKITNLFFPEELNSNDSSPELINSNYVSWSNINNNIKQRSGEKSDSGSSANYFNFQEHSFGEFGASSANVAPLSPAKKNNTTSNNFYSNSCWSPIPNDDNSPLFSSWSNVYNWINSTNPQVNIILINFKKKFF